MNDKIIKLYEESDKRKIGLARKFGESTQTTRHYIYNTDVSKAYNRLKTVAEYYGVEIEDLID